MIEVNENTIAMWQLQTADDQDFLGHLGREDGRLIFTHRFRYYEDDLIGPKSKDRKSWYRTDMTQTKEGLKLDESGAIAMVDTMVAHLVACGANGKPNKIVMHNGDVAAFYREIAKLPCFHMRPAEPGELGGNA